MANHHLYRPEMDAKCIDCGKRGLHNAQTCAELGISVSAYYDWLANDQHWREVHETYHTHYQAYWEGVFSKVLRSEMPGEAKMAIKLMEARFSNHGWGSVQEKRITGPDGGPLQIQGQWDLSRMSRPDLENKIIEVLLKPEYRKFFMALVEQYAPHLLIHQQPPPINGVIAHA